MNVAPGEYPTLSVTRIAEPSRFYAFPVIGFLVKVVMLIPVGLWLCLMMLAMVVLNSINSFVVLFTGKYWQPSYDTTVRVMRLMTKVQLFFFGLTNKYPGFSGTIDDPLISLDIPMPTVPNRLWAITILGGIAKAIILIPYGIFASVIGNGAYIGSLAAACSVLFMRKYPESIYEIVRDDTRIRLSNLAYFAGLSDKYPSFAISMNHKGVKIVLIILGILMMLGNWNNSYQNSKSSQEYPNYPRIEQMSPDYTTRFPTDLQTQ